MPDWLTEILKNPSTNVILAGKALGLSKNAAYAAVERGEIPSERFGRRRVVPTAWLRRVLLIDDTKAT
jgi:hypothetical protein